jgi:2-polyprenyl-6-methoxyphenol hydroxylase-like FAD-dependent oxidoreductase
MLLAREGLRVLCVDRSRYGSDTLSTHALMRGGVLQLQRWGLLDQLLASGTPPVRRTVFHYGADQVGVSIKPAAGVEALYAPRRTVLDTLVVDAARQAGASVEFSAPVVGLLRDRSGRASGVVVQDRRGSSTRVERAGLVVGADGRESMVAAEASAPIEVSGRHAGAYLYGYWADLPTDGYEWFYAPEVTAGLIPTNGALTCLFVGTDPARERTGYDRLTPGLAFTQLAAKVGLSDRLATASRVGSLRNVRGLPPGYLRQAYGPGWALVGDAGHWLDPMSTHGLTGALRDAELLTRAVLSGDLAGYQAERDRLSLPMLAIADRIASYAWDLPEVRVLLRRLASAMTEEVEALGVLNPPAVSESLLA